MNVTEFSGDFVEASSLVGVPQDILIELHDRRPIRWEARSGGELVALASVFDRADRRRFLRFGGIDPTAIQAIASIASSEGPIYSTVGDEEREMLSNAGFSHELTFEDFEVRFTDALAKLRRARVPGWARLVPADRADRDRLLELDNALRRDVPGTDGWEGTRHQLDEELEESPPFDPDGYLVGVEADTNELVGLVRVWRNDDGPRIGMVGVIPRLRGSFLAAALLNSALESASNWGFDTFKSGASLSNPVTYPNLRRIAQRSLGRTYRFVYPPV